MTNDQILLRRTGAFHGGTGLAVFNAVLIVWTTIVRDEGSAAGLFMIIMAAGVGGFACRFEPAGMARAMLGISVMQCALGILVATAPVTANVDGGPLMAILYNGLAAALWLVAASLYRIAAVQAQTAE